ncbi:hypothetical protein HK102_000062 [Quaeritorhiza haematococci]|nr:hypothetical protein HK102_000062 [Quaeritorhiza haematococci]
MEPVSHIDRRHHESGSDGTHPPQNPQNQAHSTDSNTIATSTFRNSPVDSPPQPDGTGKTPTKVTCIQIHTDNKGRWEGWGTSLAWWANSAGRSSFQQWYVDLFFSLQENLPAVPTHAGNNNHNSPSKGDEHGLPGLGLNIVRYNIGGGGREGDNPIRPEKRPHSIPAYRHIEGFWVAKHHNDHKDVDGPAMAENKTPASPPHPPDTEVWDWLRDSNQLSLLLAACQQTRTTLDKDRPATSPSITHVEFFSNAPEWWMMDTLSSAGGRLAPPYRRDFARYLAQVTKYALDNWDLKIPHTCISLSPFNEPSAGWWNYPKNQEGCNMSRQEQCEILGYVREELDSCGLESVTIAASDENTVRSALKTLEYFKEQTQTVSGRSVRVSDLIGKVNVHAYENGTNPCRDNKGRQALREAVSPSQKIWMSECGDNDGSGMNLAQTIVEDINHLRPCAWVYWQPLEPPSSGGWGLINGHCDVPLDGISESKRAQPTFVQNKFFVFAQFTRFIRPGFVILGSSDDYSVVAYDSDSRRLVIVTVVLARRPKPTGWIFVPKIKTNANKKKKRRLVDYDLRAMSHVGCSSASVFMTSGHDHAVRLKKSIVRVSEKSCSFEIEKNAVYTTVFEDITL